MGRFLSAGHCFVFSPLWIMALTKDTLHVQYLKCYLPIPGCLIQYVVTNAVMQAHYALR